MQFLRELEPFPSVPATGRAVLSTKLVLGNVVERIILVLGGGALTKAMVTAIRVRLNGKIVFGDISGAQLDLLQRYLLIVNDAARLTIDFSEPIARSIQGQFMGAYDTDAAGVQDFTVEVDISGATTPAITAYAMLRTPESLSPARGFDPALRPIIRALIPTSLTFSAAGEFQQDLNYGSRGNSLIKRVFAASALLTGFRAKQDSLDIFGSNAIPKALADFIAQEYGRQQQTAFYVYDRLVDGNQSDAIPTRRADGAESTFQWLWTVSGAGSVPAFSDVYTTLPAL